MSLNLVVPSVVNLKIDWFHWTKYQKSSSSIEPFSKFEWFHGTAGTTTKSGPELVYCKYKIYLWICVICWWRSTRTPLIFSSKIILNVSNATTCSWKIAHSTKIIERLTVALDRTAKIEGLIPDGNVCLCAPANIGRTVMLKHFSNRTQISLFALWTSWKMLVNVDSVNDPFFICSGLPCESPKTRWSDDLSIKAQLKNNLLFRLVHGPWLHGSYRIY